MRADQRREGRILALKALVRSRADEGSDTRRILATFAHFGSALLRGDNVITRTIAILSTVEGVTVVTTALDP